MLQIRMEEGSIDFSSMFFHIRLDSPFELVPESVTHIDAHGDFRDFQHFGESEAMAPVIEKQGPIPPDVDPHFIVIAVGLISFRANGIVKPLNAR
jgi:hypothetical protein